MLVGLDEIVCPHCRTPRDDMELEEGKALARKEEMRRLRRPALIKELIKAGIAAAVVLPIAWFFRGAVKAPLHTKWNEFQVEVEETREPAHWLKERQPITAVLAQPIQQTLPGFITQPIALSNAGPQEALGQPGRPAIPPPEPALATAAPVPKSPMMSSRAWYGVVYDLVTLQPIPSATIVYKQEGRTLTSTSTDRDGHYQVQLYRDGGNGSVSVTVEKTPGYREGVLEDRDPPLRERSPEDRKLILDETTDNDLDPVPLRCKESAEVVQLDLVLVPAAKN
jgi:hypothetical protein